MPLADVYQHQLAERIAGAFVGRSWRVATAAGADDGAVWPARLGESAMHRDLSAAGLAPPLKNGMTATAATSTRATTSFQGTSRVRGAAI